MDENQPILTMSAAGRMFRPGMLYNAINDQPIQGVSLWDEDKKTLITTRQAHMDVGVCFNDNFDCKARIFDIDGELKLSLIAGIVEAGGSVRYLKDNKSSFKKHRAALYVKQTTKDVEFQLPKLPVDSPNILLKKGFATHIVTSVTYGGYCVFIFEDEISDVKETDKASTKLESSVKLAKTFLGKTSCQLSPEEQNKYSRISCHFHGDLDIDSIPTTYEKALELIQKVPGLIKAAERPVKVRLLPLSLYFGEETTIYHMISSDLVHEAGHYIQNLEDALAVADHLRKTKFCEQLCAVKKLLNEFYKIVSVHRRKLQQKIALTIPKIRSSGDGESQLMLYLVLSQETSPFSSDSLVHWIQDKEKELRVLELWMHKLEGIGAQLVFNRSDLTVQLAGKTEPVLVINFPSALKSKFIPALKNYLQKQSSSDFEYDIAADEEAEYKSTADSSHLDCCWADMSSKFAPAEKDFWSLVEFLKRNSMDLSGRVFVSELASCEEMQFTFKKVIRQQGKGEMPFEVPLPPKIIEVVDISPTSVQVSWRGPNEGSDQQGWQSSETMSGFVFEYKQRSQLFGGMRDQYHSAADENKNNLVAEWTNIDITMMAATMEEKIVVKKLLPGTEYLFRMKTKTPVGDSEWSDPVKHCLQPDIRIPSMVISDMWATQVSLDGVTNEFSGVIYKLKSIQLDEESPQLSEKLFQFTFGSRPDEPLSVPHVKKFQVGGLPIGFIGDHEVKTIWLVGESGCGKRTLMDAIANAYYGVSFENNHRLTLRSDSKQHDSEENDSGSISPPFIVEYNLHPFIVTNRHDGQSRVVNFSLKIVDIPSFTSNFMDVHMVENQRSPVHVNGVIVHEIEEYINSQLEAPQVVAFVTKGTQKQLSCAEKCAFGHLLSMFPAELKDMFITISTYSSPTASAAETGSKAKFRHDLGIEVTDNFSVDNSVLFGDNSQADVRDNKRQKLVFAMVQNQWELNRIAYQGLLELLSNRPAEILFSREKMQGIRENRKTLRRMATFVSRKLQDEAFMMLPALEKAIGKYNCRRNCWQTGESEEAMATAAVDFVKQALAPYESLRSSILEQMEVIQNCLLHLSENSILQYPAEAAVEFESYKKAFLATHISSLQQWVMTSSEPADIIHDVLTRCNPLQALTEQIIALLRAGDVDELAMWPFLL